MSFHKRNIDINFHISSVENIYLKKTNEHVYAIISRNLHFCDVYAGKVTNLKMNYWKIYTGIFCCFFFPFNNQLTCVTFAKNLSFLAEDAKKDHWLKALLERWLLNIWKNVNNFCVDCFICVEPSQFTIIFTRTDLCNILVIKETASPDYMVSIMEKC